MRSRIGVEGTIGSIHSSKDRLQTVIIPLGDRIELVVMATRAVNCEALKRRHGGHDHIVAIVVARDQTIGFAFRQFDVADKIPRTGRNKAGRHDSIR